MLANIEKMLTIFFIFLKLHQLPFSVVTSISFVVYFQVKEELVLSDGWFARFTKVLVEQILDHHHMAQNTLKEWDFSNH